MSKIGKLLTGIAMTLALAFGIAATVPLANVLANDDYVVDKGISGGADAGQTDEMATQLFGESGVVTNIISVVIFIVGALCVIMLVWGGIQYILSAGDSGKVTSAKNTILYAVIGLIVCIVAYAVVQFVLVNLGT
ncbi:pilin [Candidatus Saccharibacteria bacterium]|nr:pilin [Candidatus Saccharibacteria bacterium]